jgi:hypothetical protein
MRILYIVLILQASYIGNFLVSAFKCLSSEWCLNGGTCDLETGICTCLPGWTEENCDTCN